MAAQYYSLSILYCSFNFRKNCIRIVSFYKRKTVSFLCKGISKDFKVQLVVCRVLAILFDSKLLL